MEPPGSRHGSHVPTSPQGPTVSKALTTYTAKLMSKLLYGTKAVLRIIQTSKRWRELQRLGYQAETQRIREGATLDVAPF
jgi:hypothetical protein